MTSNAYLRYLRVYAALALRKRRSYLDAVRALVVLRWEAARLGLVDGIDPEEVKMGIAVDAVRNYGRNDPWFAPDLQTALSWMDNLQAQP